MHGVICCASGIPLKASDSKMLALPVWHSRERCSTPLYWTMMPIDRHLLLFATRGFGRQAEEMMKLTWSVLVRRT